EGYRLVFVQEFLDCKLAEIGEGETQRLVIPVPPGQPHQPILDRFRKTPLDRPRRIAADDGVGSDVLGDDGAAGDDSAVADLASGQHDRAMPDPDVVADMNAMALAPFEEFGVVALARKIGARTISEMRLRGAVHRMITRIDPRHRRDRAELA